MKHARLIVSAGIVYSVIGCGSQPSQQTIAPPPQPQPIAQGTAQSPSPAAQVNEVVPPSREAQPDLITKQAEAHAKAIEALLAARARTDAESHGAKIIEPTPPEKMDPEARMVALAPAPAAGGITGVVRTEQTDARPPTEPKANVPVSIAMAGGGAPDVRQPSAVERATAPKTDESLEQQLARRAREYPRDLAAQLNYQLALFVKDETVPRSADLTNLAPEDREVLTALVDGLVNFRNTVESDSNQLMTKKIRPIVEMADRMRSRSDLAIPTATLCREVKGFGSYTPLDSTRFAAGVAHKVIVYCEVDNFSSQLNDKNLWETRLAHELVLYTESGLPVWEDKQPEVPDTCRNRRRDFFIGKLVQLPANLNMGRYVLKVSVVDKQSNRVAETSIPISVVAK